MAFTLSSNQANYSLSQVVHGVHSHAMLMGEKILQKLPIQSRSSSSLHPHELLMGLEPSISSNRVVRDPPSIPLVEGKLITITLINNLLGLHGFIS